MFGQTPGSAVGHKAQSAFGTPSSEAPQRLTSGGRGARGGGRGRGSRGGSYRPPFKRNSNRPDQKDTKDQKPFGESQKPLGDNNPRFSKVNHFQKTKQLVSVEGLEPTPSGWKPRRIPDRPLPVYLSGRQTSVFEVTAGADPWDTANQARMGEVVAKYNGSNLQAQYEELQAMRENERQQMETKGLVDRLDVRKDLKNAIVFRGSCVTMCPLFERVRRIYENNVKQMEKDPATGKVTERTAVKAFSRPAAGQPPPLPSDVRPPQTLRRTLDYLIEKGVPQLPSSHSFLWDRTRSIRQDFTYQNYAGQEAVECNEIIARIHLVCLHVMAGSGQEYSKQQELEQFNKTLQTLTEFYAERRRLGLEDSSREGEMRAYQLLSHLRDPEIERQVQDLPKSIVFNKWVQMALRLRMLIQQNNFNPQFQRRIAYTENCANFFSVYFKIIREDKDVTFLMACLLESSFNDVRLLAVKSLARACHARGKPYLLSRLTEMLGFDSDDDTQEFCEYYKMPVTRGDQGVATVEITAYDDKVVAEQAPKPQPFTRYIDNKLEGKTLCDIIKHDSSSGISGGVFEFAKSITTTNRETLFKPEPIQPKVFGGSPFASAPPSQPASIPPSQPASKQVSPFSRAPSVQPPAPKINGTVTPVFNFTKPSIPSIPTASKIATEAPAKIEIPTQSPSPLTLPEAKKELPVPIVPVKKEPPKPQFSESDYYEQMKKLVQTVVNEELRTTAVPKAWKEIETLRQTRQEQIEETAVSMYQDLILDTVIHQVAYSYARALDRRRVWSSAIHRFKQAALRAKDIADEKKRRLDEVNSVTAELGRAVVRRRVSRKGSKKRLNEGLYRGEDSQVAQIQAVSNSARQVWTPLDLAEIALPPLEQAFKKNRMFDRQVKYTIFCEDWESTTGKWMRTKFRLELSPRGRYESTIERNGTQLTVSNLENDPETFRVVGGVIFECGINDLSVDYERLREIMQRITPESRFRLSVMLLYLGSLDEAAVYAGLQVAQYDVPVVFCGAGGGDAQVNLETAVRQLSGTFDATYSARGQRERDDILAEQERAAKMRRRKEQEVLRSQQQMAEQKRFEDMRRYSSLQYFGKADRRPDEEEAQKRKRSIRRTVSSCSIDESLASSPIPQSILDLNKLVAGVLSKRAKK
ncbi:nuclear mRNA export protein Sac3p [Trichomonascus vanleenenianus]|uniref:Sac3p n=1 Tax=Trichomonascus vanleenenianus TaxID=2268995 RepID=UPI003ECB9022